MTRRALTPLSPDERSHFRRAFSSSICTLLSAEMFWSPTARRIFARAVLSERPRYALPRDAVSIGTYAYPSLSEDFLGDLEDVLEKIRAQRSTLKRA